MTAIDQIYTKIKRSRRYVFERSDFDDIASYDQVGRALQQLVEMGRLMRIGYGLYTKTRINSLTGKPMLAKPGGADSILLEVFKLKGIDYDFAGLSKQSIAGASTQIPASIKFNWDTKQFSRKLKIGRKLINEQ